MRISHIMLIEQNCIRSYPQWQLACLFLLHVEHFTQASATFLKFVADSSSAFRSVATWNLWPKVLFLHLFAPSHLSVIIIIACTLLTANIQRLPCTRHCSCRECLSAKPFSSLGLPLECCHLLSNLKGKEANEATQSNTRQWLGWCITLRCRFYPVPLKLVSRGWCSSDSRDSTVAVTPALRVALPKIQKIHRELLDCPVSAEVYTASLCMHWKVCRCQRIRYVRDLQVEMCRNCNTLKLDTLS